MRLLASSSLVLRQQQSQPRNSFAPLLCTSCPICSKILQILSRVPSVLSCIGYVPSHIAPYAWSVLSQAAPCAQSFCFWAALCAWSLLSWAAPCAQFVLSWASPWVAYVTSRVHFIFNLSFITFFLLFKNFLLYVNTEFQRFSDIKILGKVIGKWPSNTLLFLLSKAVTTSLF